MNQFEMAVIIVAIVMFAGIMRTRYQYRSRTEGEVDSREHAENLRLREEVSELKERLKVLERITVDKENSLARQIDELRDR